MTTSGLTPAIASRFGSKCMPTSTISLSFAYGDSAGSSPTGAAASSTSHAASVSNVRLSSATTFFGSTGTLTVPCASLILTVFGASASFFVSASPAFPHAASKTASELTTSGVFHFPMMIQLLLFNLINMDHGLSSRWIMYTYVINLFSISDNDYHCHIHRE